MVFVITPTYRRAEQMAELTNLAQTLDIPRDRLGAAGIHLHWIVTEDAKNCTTDVSKLLQRMFQNGKKANMYLLEIRHIHNANQVI